MAKYWVSNSFNVFEDVYLYRILTEGREDIKVGERVWITTEEAVAEQLASVLNEETKTLTEMLDESQHNLVQRNLEVQALKKQVEEMRDLLINTVAYAPEYEPSFYSDDSKALIIDQFRKLGQRVKKFLKPYNAPFNMD